MAGGPAGGGHHLPQARPARGPGWGGFVTHYINHYHNNYHNNYTTTPSPKPADSREVVLLIGGEGYAGGTRVEVELGKQTMSIGQAWGSRCGRELASLPGPRVGAEAVYHG